MVNLIVDYKFYKTRKVKIEQEISISQSDSELKKQNTKDKVDTG